MYEGSINGLRVITNSLLADQTEDWSDVRSPARAARRRKQGKPQRIKITLTPRRDFVRVGDTLYCHPAMLLELRKRLTEAAADSWGIIGRPPC